MDIFLRFPQKKDKQKVEEYKQKFLSVSCESPDALSLPGCGPLAKLDFDNWLKLCHDHMLGKNLPSGYVAATQFLTFRKSDNKLIGMIQIRHELTPFLKRIGGHIGIALHLMNGAKDTVASN